MAGRFGKELKNYLEKREKQISERSRHGLYKDRRADKEQKRMEEESKSNNETFNQMGEITRKERLGSSNR